MCAQDPSSWEGYPIYIDLYVDDFVYFTEYDSMEEQCHTSLSYMLQVDYHGDTEWFIGT